MAPGLNRPFVSWRHGNTIPLFADPASRQRLVARLKTDSRRPGQPGDPATCLVYGLYRQFATEDEQASMSRRYREGGIGYAEAKACLAQVIDRELGEAGERFRDLRADQPSLRAVLADGAARAGRVASATMARVRRAVGTGDRLTR